MITRRSDAEWRGDLLKGAGTVKLGSGAYEGKYGFQSRFENGPGTNPEELIAAAHAGCYSMALSLMLSEAGHPPTRVHTQARVKLDKVEGGFAITGIDLETVGEVPGLDAKKFDELAQAAKKNCPVSKALSAVPIALKATLK